MAKEPWRKGRLGKIKNSPAAKDLSKVLHTPFNQMGRPSSNHPADRFGHFNEGAGEHVHVLPEDNDKFHHFYENGLGMGKDGNVSSIVNGIAIRGRKAAARPEGYE